MFFTASDRRAVTRGSIVAALALVLLLTTNTTDPAYGAPATTPPVTVPTTASWTIEPTIVVEAFTAAPPEPEPHILAAVDLPILLAATATATTTAPAPEPTLTLVLPPAVTPKARPLTAPPADRPVLRHEDGSWSDPATGETGCEPGALCDDTGRPPLVLPEPTPILLPAAPEPAPQPATEPEPAPQPQPAPEPAPEPQPQPEPAVPDAGADGPDPEPTLPDDGADGPDPDPQEAPTTTT